MNDAIQRAEADGIDPVHVLEDRHDRPAAPMAPRPAAAGPGASLLALLRRKIEPGWRWIDAGSREQLGDQRGVIGRRRSVREQGLKLVELRRGIVLPFEPRGALSWPITGNNGLSL